jgi:anaerobic ribonucleoside-triphosphate reductase activating protein
MSLNTALIHAPVLVLGPGVRLGLWLAGCRQRCPGCLSPDFQDPAAGRVTETGELAEHLVRLARAHQTDRLTVSGGEPFDQGPELGVLLGTLREKGLKDILVYSGRRLSELEPLCPWIPRLVTALVDGPFEIDRPCREIYRGSAGQKLHIFDKTLKPAYRRWARQTRRQVQILSGESSLRLLGIPGRDDYDQLNRLLAENSRQARRLSDAFDEDLQPGA